MKISSAATTTTLPSLLVLSVWWLFLLCAASIPLARGGCSNNDKPCEQHRGQCTAGVVAALFEKDLAKAEELIFYGKYCGKNNQCYSNEMDGGVTVGQGNLGLDGAVRGPPSCDDDGVDEGCKQHDACLNRKVQLFGKETMPLADRCECNVELIVSMQAAFDPTDPTGLCDADFYSTETGPIPNVAIIDLIHHEAGLVAGPFCCFILAPGYCSDTTSGAANGLFAGAADFCTALLGGLASNGINLCGP